MVINCPICNFLASFFVCKEDRFSQKYEYFKCSKCRFLFDKDLVLNKDKLALKTSRVYDRDYFNCVDSGWQLRGDKMAKVINGFLKILRIVKYPKKLRVLDYGAGNGYITSKISPVADIFYYDKYEKPIYHGNYKILERPEKAELLCAVELVEHLADIKEWDLIFGLSLKAMVATTEVSDGILDNELSNWEYLNPDAGHTAIYSFESLYLLARKHGFFYFFFPYKLSHIFIKSRFLSKFNFAKTEYFLYRLIKKIRNIFIK